MYTVFTWWLLLKPREKNISSMVIYGMVVKDQNVIADYVVSYYKNLYRCGNTLENDLIAGTIPSLVTGG